MISATAYWVGKKVLDNLVEPSGLGLRFSGFVICGIDLTLLMTMLVDSVFPA
ncbi:MAG: hypothetical protein F6K09_04755 [Merismopedia sp. SIO2A8]|nr:hypothetical protein [Merismopedia sp. SIO2A8]